MIAFYDLLDPTIAAHCCQQLHPQAFFDDIDNFMMHSGSFLHILYGLPASGYSDKQTRKTANSKTEKKNWLGYEMKLIFSKKIVNS